jgi:hypothetical protein
LRTSNRKGILCWKKTSIHVPGHARHRYDAEIKELEEKIKEIEAKLHQ